MGVNEIGRPAKDATHLSKEVILTVALKLLDESGDHAVTFRALAKEFDVTPMAIAHHVGTRKELIASLIAQVYVDVGKEPNVMGVKNRICAMLEQYCERAIAHPNLVQCIFADPSLFSGQLVVLTRKIGENLAMGGVNPSELEMMVGVIIDYTHGFAISVAAFSGTGEEQENRMKGQTIDDYLRGLRWLLNDIS